jgi:pimeloyl-ACP methyl ester carboxylesterase
MLWQVAAVLVALLVAFDLFVRSISVRVALGFFEKMPSFGIVPADPDPDVEVIQFPTSNGLTLRGSVYRHAGLASRGLVVFCPELGGNHWMAMRYCEGIRQAGFDILAFDFRNQGDSDHLSDYEPLHWLTAYEVDDVLAAIDFTKHRGDLNNRPLFLFGVSRGGGAALAAAARSPDVTRVACDSAFSTDSMMAFYARRWAPLIAPDWLLRLIPFWHIRTTLVLVRQVSRFLRGRNYTILERILPRLRTKSVYLIGGKRDTYVPAAIPEELARRIGPACTVWIVPKAKHNGARSVQTVEYDRRLVEFFSGETPLATEPID